MTDDKRGPGQPSKYKPEYCKMLIDHMAKGFSFETFGADILVGRRTLYQWVDEHLDFREAKEVGHAQAQKLFEQISIAKLSGKTIPNFDPKKSDTAMLIFYQKTRFHKTYGENTSDLEGDDDLEINT